MVPLDYDVATGQITGVLAALGGNQGPGGGMGPGGRWELDEATGAWVLLPPQTPFAVVHFIGGAGFGTYPRLAYAQLLERVVERCGGGVAVVATPFEAGLAHGDLAAASLKTFDDVLARVAERELWLTKLRTFRLGHSLGAKLHVLNAPAYQESSLGGEPPAAGQAVELGLLAFNNFALKDSISQAVAFLEAISGGGGRAFGGFGGFQQQIVEFATMAVAASGLEFDPGPDATRALLGRLSSSSSSCSSSSSASASSQQQSQADDQSAAPPQASVPVAVTAFRFADDSLDSTSDLLVLDPEAGQSSGTGSKSSSGSGGSSSLELVELEGEHLTSVFVKVSAADLAANTVAPEIVAPLLDANGAFSFGSEELLDEAADAVVAWIVPSKAKKAPAPKALAAGAD